MSQLFSSGGQSIEASTSAPVLPMNIQGRFPFRVDWSDLLAVQRALKSLLQHHSSKASILWCSAFFTVQLSHPYMTTGKTIALPLFIVFFTNKLFTTVPPLPTSFILAEDDIKSSGLGHFRKFSLVSPMNK